MAKSPRANARKGVSNDFLTELVTMVTHTVPVTYRCAPHFKINKHYSDLNLL